MADDLVLVIVGGDVVAKKRTVEVVVDYRAESVGECDRRDVSFEGLGGGESARISILSFPIVQYSAVVTDAH